MASAPPPLIKLTQRMNYFPRGPYFSPLQASSPPRRRRRRPPTATAIVFHRRNKSSTPATTPLQHWNFVGGHVNRIKRSHLHGPSTLLAWLQPGSGEVSARKLAAFLWQLGPPAAGASDCNGSGAGGRRDGDDQRLKGKCGSFDGVGNEPHISNVDTSSPSGCSTRGHGDRGKQLLVAPPYNSQLQHGMVFKLESPVLYGKYALERATKWDSVCSSRSHKAYFFCGRMTFLQNRVANVYVAPAMQPGILQVQRQIRELEAECQSCKKKLERIVRKFRDEGTSRKLKEHKKFRGVIRDLETELSREKKRCKTMEIINSQLINELRHVRASARQFRQDYEKEKEARKILEEVCNGLVNKIAEDKAEVEVFKKESIRIQEELQEERKMLQMAEVWREERVQMKLIDAKLALESKYNQMNKLIADLERFMRSGSIALDTMEIRKADSIRQAAKLVSVNDIKEFFYAPQKSRDINSIFLEIQQAESNERALETGKQPTPGTDNFEVRSACSVVNDHNNCQLLNQLRHVVDDNYFPEDQGSTYSLKRSDFSDNKFRQAENVWQSEREDEENSVQDSPNTRIGEVCSVLAEWSIHKAASITNVCETSSTNGESCQIQTDGRLSNGTILGLATSPKRKTCEDRPGLRDIVGQPSSQGLRNPHVAQGMKGLTEWPRGIWKNHLKGKPLEARIQSQKGQLRNILKQKA